MTAQEQQMLQGLVERVNRTQLPEKDSDAEQMLQQTLGRNPDGLYILAQTVLVQQYALDQAQKQLAEARAQADQLRQQTASSAGQPRHTGSFLGNLLGLNDDPPARPTPPPPPAQYAPVQGYAPAPTYAPAYAPAPSYGMLQQGGFLRSAMQTAAGVAAGALAFEGIESLMHGFGHAAGYGSGFGGFDGQPREEIVNNYYGDAAPGHTGNLSPDLEDRRGDSSTFSQAVANDDHGDLNASDDDSSGGGTGDTSNFADDSPSFDSGGDDTGSFDSGGGDDGGSFDSGGGDGS